MAAVGPATTKIDTGTFFSKFICTVFLFSFIYFFLNIFRNTPGLPNVTEYNYNLQRGQHGPI